MPAGQGKQNMIGRNPDGQKGAPCSPERDHEGDEEREQADRALRANDPRVVKYGNFEFKTMSNTCNYI
jgi:hypothetical protein